MQFIYALMTCYAAGAGATVIVMVLLMRGGRGRTQGNLSALALISFNWHITGFFYCLSGDPLRAAHLKDTALPYMSFFLVALLFYSLRFFGFERYHKPVSILLLCVIPALTFAVTAVGGRYDFLLAYREVGGVWPEFWIKSSPGVWFIVHSGYCIAVTAFALLIALVGFRRLPRIYKGSGLWLIGGIVISGTGAMLSLYGIPPSLPDPGILGAAVCTVMCWISGRNAQEMEAVSQIRGDVFDEIDKCIFILDSAGCVTTLNRAARAHLERLGIPFAVEASYNELIGRAFGAAIRREIAGMEDGSMDYVLKTGGEEKVYNLREKDIPDRRGKKLGAVAVWSDVTENRAVILKLEETAGLDALTGLLNRNRIEREILELDVPENLPIAVIVGDLNNLKAINDTFGHQWGDFILRAAAEGLRFCCPPKALIARSGGDEFIAVIPRYTRVQAQSLIRSLDAYFASPLNPHTRIVMALGSSVKLSRDQDIHEVIAQADALMYADKHRKKFG